MSFLRYALITVPLVLLLGTLSGRLAGSGYGNPWFDALVKPDFMPEGSVFGAAWTILYILLGFSLALLLHAHGARRRGLAVAFFVLQLGCNYAWSPLFFAFHELGWAMTLIGVMVVLTVTLIVLLWPVRRMAALLLLPYLAWLCFAALLTFEIASLNPNADEVAPQQESTDIVL